MDDAYLDAVLSCSPVREYVVALGAHGNVQIIIAFPRTQFQVLIIGPPWLSWFFASGPL